MTSPISRASAAWPCRRALRLPPQRSRQDRDSPLVLDRMFSRGDRSAAPLRTRQARSDSPQHRSGGAHRAARSPDPPDDRHDRAVAVPQPAARGANPRMGGAAAALPVVPPVASPASQPPIQPGPCAARRPRRSPAAAPTCSIRRRIRTRLARRGPSDARRRSGRAAADHRGRAAGRRAGRPRSWARRSICRRLQATPGRPGLVSGCRNGAASRFWDGATASRGTALPPPPSRNPSATGAARRGRAALGHAEGPLRSRLRLCAAQGLRTGGRRLPGLPEEISDRSARGRRAILARRKPVPAPALRRGGAGLPRPLDQAQRHTPRRRMRCCGSGNRSRR